MNEKERFYEAVSSEMALTLATSAGGRVSMRLVSPVRDGDAILIFTARTAQKYRDLQENPNCCVAVGGFFAQCTAQLLGPAMDEGNRALRARYCEKFPAAFDENVDYGGRDCDFIRLRPTFLTGWGFAGGTPTPDGIPNEPFAIPLP